MIFFHSLNKLAANFFIWNISHLHFAVISQIPQMNKHCQYIILIFKGNHIILI